jgi:hypothetical protein
MMYGEIDEPARAAAHLRQQALFHQQQTYFQQQTDLYHRSPQQRPQPQPSQPPKSDFERIADDVGTAILIAGALLLVWWIVTRVIAPVLVWSFNTIVYGLRRLHSRIAQNRKVQL